MEANAETATAVAPFDKTDFIIFLAIGSGMIILLSVFIFRCWGNDGSSVCQNIIDFCFANDDNVLNSTIVDVGVVGETRRHPHRRRDTNRNASSLLIPECRCQHDQAPLPMPSDPLISPSVIPNLSPPFSVFVSPPIVRFLDLPVGSTRNFCEPTKMPPENSVPCVNNPSAPRTSPVIEYCAPSIATKHIK